MKRGQRLGIVVVGVVVLIAFFVLGQWRGAPNPSLAGLLNYTNSVYHYTVLYPSDEKADYIAENETIPASQSGDIMIYKLGGPTEFGVTAYEPLNSTHTQASIKTRADLVGLPLRQFAETIREDQVNAGALATTTFAGHEAYSFTLTGSFN